MLALLNQRDGSESDKKTVVLFINDKICLVVLSLIYSKKRRGPRIEPCGTPDLTGNLADI